MMKSPQAWSAAKKKKGRNILNTKIEERKASFDSDHLLAVN